MDKFVEIEGRYEVKFSDNDNVTEKELSEMINKTARKKRPRVKGKLVYSTKPTLIK